MSALFYTKFEMIFSIEGKGVYKKEKFEGSVKKRM